MACIRLKEDVAMRIMSARMSGNIEVLLYDEGFVCMAPADLKRLCAAAGKLDDVEIPWLSTGNAWAQLFIKYEAIEDEGAIYDIAFFQQCCMAIGISYTMIPVAFNFANDLLANKGDLGEVHLEIHNVL